MRNLQLIRWLRPDPRVPGPDQKLLCDCEALLILPSAYIQGLSYNETHSEVRSCHVRRLWLSTPAPAEVFATDHNAVVSG